MRLFALSLLLTISACAPKPPPFNFDAATPDEQQKWLEPIAKEMHRGFSAALESNGMINKMRAEAPEIYASERRVVLAYKYALSNMQASGDLLAAQKSLLERTCKSYMESQLAPNNIRLVLEVRKTDDSVDFNAVNSPEECAPYVAAK